VIACININNRMRACVDGKNAFPAVELDPLHQSRLRWSESELVQASDVINDFFTGIM
jgi:hypothetical protein